MQIRASEEYLEIINELLPTASAAGAYAVGLVTVLGWQRGLEPTRAVLESAAKCSTFAEAVELFEEWRKLQAAS